MLALSVSYHHGASLCFQVKGKSVDLSRAEWLGRVGVVVRVPGAGTLNGTMRQPGHSLSEDFRALTGSGHPRKRTCRNQKSALGAVSTLGSRAPVNGRSTLEARGHVPLDHWHPNSKSTTVLKKSAEPELGEVELFGADGQRSRYNAARGTEQPHLLRVRPASLHMALRFMSQTRCAS